MALSESQANALYWDSGGAARNSGSSGGSSGGTSYSGVNIYKEQASAQNYTPPSTANLSAKQSLMSSRGTTGYVGSQQRSAYTPTYTAVDTWDARPESYDGYAITLNSGLKDKGGNPLDFTLTGSQLNTIKGLYKAACDQHYQPNDEDTWRKQNGYVPLYFENNYSNNDVDRFLLNEGLPSLQYLPNYLEVANIKEQETEDIDNQYNSIQSLYTDVANDMLKRYAAGVRDEGDYWIDEAGAVVDADTLGAAKYSYQDLLAKTFYDRLDSEQYRGLTRWMTQSAVDKVDRSKYKTEREYREALIAAQNKDAAAASKIADAQATAIDKGQAGKEMGYSKSAYMFYEDPKISLDEFEEIYNSEILPRWLEDKVITDATEIALVGGETRQDLLDYLDRYDRLQNVAQIVTDKDSALDYVATQGRNYSNPFDAIIDMQDAGVGKGALDASVKALRKELQDDVEIKDAETFLKWKKGQYGAPKAVDLTDRYVLSAAEMAEAFPDEFDKNDRQTLTSIYATVIPSEDDTRFVVATPILPKGQTVNGKRVIGKDQLTDYVNRYMATREGNVNASANRFILGEFQSQEQADAFVAKIQQASETYLPMYEIKNWGNDDGRTFSQNAVSGLHSVAHTIGEGVRGLTGLAREELAPIEMSAQGAEIEQQIGELWQTMRDNPDQASELQPQLDALLDEYEEERKVAKTNTAKGRADYIRDYVVDPYYDGKTSVPKTERIASQIWEQLLGENPIPQNPIGNALDNVASLAGLGENEGSVASELYNFMRGHGVSAPVRDKIFDALGLSTTEEINNASDEETRAYFKKAREEIVGKGIMSDFDFDQAMRANNMETFLDPVASARNYYVEGRQDMKPEEWNALSEQQRQQYTDFFQQNWTVLPDVDKPTYMSMVGAMRKVSDEGAVRRLGNNAIALFDFVGSIFGNTDHSILEQSSNEFQQYWGYGSNENRFLPKVIGMSGDVVSEIQRMYTSNAIGEGLLNAVGKTAPGAAMLARSGQTIRDSIGAQKVITGLAKTGEYLVRSSPFMMSATGNYYTEALQGGASERQALMYGFVLGGIEGLVESFNTDEIWGRAFGQKNLARGLFANRNNAAVTGKLINRARLINLIASFLGEGTEEGIGYAASWGMRRMQGWGDQEFSVQDMLSDSLQGGIIGLIGSAMSVGAINANDVMWQNANTIAEYIAANPEEMNAELGDILVSTSLSANMTPAKRAEYTSRGMSAILTQDNYNGLMTNILNNRRAIENARQVQGEMQAAQTRAEETKKKLSSAKGQATRLYNQMIAETDPVHKAELAEKYNKALTKRAEAESEANTAAARLAEVSQEKLAAARATEQNAMASITRDADKIMAHHAMMANVFQEAGIYSRQMAEATDATMQNVTRSIASKQLLDVGLIRGDLTTESYDAAVANIVAARDTAQQYDATYGAAGRSLDQAEQDVKDMRSGKYQQREANASNAQESVQAEEQAAPVQAEQQAQNAAAEPQAASVETQAAQEQQASNAQQAGEVIETALRAVTDEERQYTERQAKRLGIKVQWDDMAPSDRGYYDIKTRTVHLNPQVRDTQYDDIVNNPAMIAFKHEMTHYLRNSKYWPELQRFVLNYIANDSSSDQASRIKAEIAADYQRRGEAYDDSIGNEEMVAYWVQDHLMRDQEAIDRLVSYNSSLASRILYKAQYARARMNLNGDASSRTILLDQIEYAYSKALLDAGKRPSADLPLEAIRRKSDDSIGNIYTGLIEGGESISYADFVQQLDQEYNELLNTIPQSEWDTNPKIRAVVAKLSTLGMGSTYIVNPDGSIVWRRGIDDGILNQINNKYVEGTDDEGDYYDEDALELIDAAEEDVVRNGEPGRIGNGQAQSPDGGRNQERDGYVNQPGDGGYTGESPAQSWDKVNSRKVFDKVTKAFNKEHGLKGNDAIKASDLQAIDMPTTARSGNALKLAMQRNGGMPVRLFTSSNPNVPGGFFYNGEIYVKDTGDGIVAFEYAHEYAHARWEIQTSGRNVLASMGDAGKKALQKYCERFRDNPNDPKVVEEFISDLYGAFEYKLQNGFNLLDQMGLSEADALPFFNAFAELESKDTIVMGSESLQPAIHDVAIGLDDNAPAEVREMDHSARPKHPFVINADISDWSPNMIARALMYRNDGDTTQNVYGKEIDIGGSEINLGKKTLKEIADAANGNRFPSGESVPLAERWAIVTRALNDAGYDGIQYDGGKKHVVLTPDKIRFSGTSVSESAVNSKMDADYMDAVNRGDMETAQRMVNERAAALRAEVFAATDVPTYRVRRDYTPKKTIKVYKTFTLDQQGRPSALFVSSQHAIPVGVWLDAQDTFHFTDTKNGRMYVPSTKNPNTDGGATGESHALANISENDLAELEARGYIKKGKNGRYTSKNITALAYRPGWHAGDLPFFPQGGMQVDGSNYKNIHRYNQVVFECEMAIDEDYTSYDVKEDGRIVYHDMQQMPVNGAYKFATNPMANSADIGAWYISGALKINRALTEEECNQILAENGYAPQEWQAYQDPAEYKAIKGDEAKTAYKKRMGSLDLNALGYDPNQTDGGRKLLDPVTYDDNGNVIPLSQRFNPGINDPRFNYHSMSEDRAAFRQDLLNSGIVGEGKPMSMEELDALFDTIDRVMQIVEKRRDILDFFGDAGKDTRAFHPYKENGDPHYKMALDFSTLCRKRILAQTIAERLQDQLQRSLTPAESVAIRNEIQRYQKMGKKVEVACALCYVEAARLKGPKVINEFLDDRAKFIKHYMALKNKDFDATITAKKKEYMEAHTADHDPNATKDALTTADRKEFDRLVKQWRSEYVPTAEEQETINRAVNMPRERFLNAGSLTKMAKEEPIIYKAYTSRIVSAARQKAPETAVPYFRGDIDSVSDALIMNMNKESGFRHQSWSDFEVIHLLDNISAVIEMSTRKLKDGTVGAKMHAYTKVPIMVMVNGRTGMMINMSLIPEGKTGIRGDNDAAKAEMKALLAQYAEAVRNGQDTSGLSAMIEDMLLFDPVEGMPVDQMKRLRDHYSSTAGNIMIGINDTQIRGLLACDLIDYVIPYHTSGLNAEMRRRMGIKTWDDYTKTQNEKIPKGSKEKAPALAEWFKIDEARNAEDGVKYMQDASRKYLELCNQRKIVPKFPQFLHKTADGSYELADDALNYWKLLIDRKMVDQKTNKVIEQKAVVPRFDEHVVDENGNETDELVLEKILNDEIANPSHGDDEEVADKIVKAVVNGELEISKSIKESVKNFKKRAIEYAIEDMAVEAGLLDPDASVAVMQDPAFVAKKTDAPDVDAVASKAAANAGKDGMITGDEEGRFRAQDIPEENRHSLANVERDENGAIIPPSARAEGLVDNIRHSAVEQAWNEMFASDAAGANDIKYAKAMAINNGAGMRTAIDSEAKDVGAAYGNQLVDRMTGAPIRAAIGPDGNYIPVAENAAMEGTRYLFARNPMLVASDGQIPEDVRARAEESGVLPDADDPEAPVAWTRDQYITYAKDAGYDSVKFTDGSIALIEDNGAIAEDAAPQPEGVPSEMFPNVRRYSVDTSRWDPMRRQYGVIEPGMEPRADTTTVPRQTNDTEMVSKFIRSVMEGEFSDDVKQYVSDELGINGFGVHDVLTNAETADRAKQKIAQSGGITKATQDLKAKILNGRPLTTVETNVGLQLIAEANARGDTAGVLDLIGDMAIAATEAGRQLQIFSILKKTKGIGSVVYINKMVERLNKQFEKQIDRGRMQPITVDQALLETLAAARTTFQVEEAEQAIMEHIGLQLPLSVSEALRNWRYFAMLANPVTHIRNFVGNIAMYGVTGLKNAVASGLEAGATAAGIMQQGDRAHAATTRRWDADATNLAETEWLNSGRRVATGTGKYNPEQLLRANKRLSHFKLVEKAERGVSNALERVDELFLHANYVRAFTGYMRAKGLTAETMSNADIAAASSLAVDEALKATYRDASNTADALNKLRQQKGYGWIVEGIIPFTKTPINIAKRSIEYSPIGLINGAVQTIRAFHGGEISKADAIDKLSAGITGTGLFALGYFLAKAGLLRAKGEDDDKAEAFLEGTSGVQQYSINLGDYASMDLSFAAPTSVPLFMGAALHEAAGQDLSMSTVLDIVNSALDPMMEMSFLSSVNAAIESYHSADGVGGNLGAAISNAIKSYIGQYFPTAGAKIVNTIDPFNRSGKGDITSPVGATWDAYLRSIAKKTPGANFLLQPAVDVHGRKIGQDTFGEWALEFANSWILPGRVNLNSRDRTDQALIDLYRSTGRVDILPTLPSAKYLTYKSTRYPMDAEQYRRYCEDYGTDAYLAIKGVMAGASWSGMDDAEKCEAIADALGDAHKQTRNRWLEKFGALD